MRAQLRTKLESAALESHTSGERDRRATELEEKLRATNHDNLRLHDQLRALSSERDDLNAVRAVSQTYAYTLGYTLGIPSGCLRIAPPVLEAPERRRP